MLDMVLKEIDTLVSELQPLMTVFEADSGVTISGKYKICNQIATEVFEDYFALEIFVPEDFPYDIPTVKATDGKIRAVNYREHIYPNGQLCLEIDTAIAAFLQDRPSLLAFLSRFLDVYLCGFLYYKKYKLLPFGEHKHGIEGLLDYYCELFNTADKNSAYRLLRCMFKDKIKGHIDCPCQSGKRYRNCHRGQISELKASELSERYMRDLATILAEIEYRNKRRT